MNNKNKNTLKGKQSDQGSSQRTRNRGKEMHSTQPSHPKNNRIEKYFKWCLKLCKDEDSKGGVVSREKVQLLRRYKNSKLTEERKQLIVILAVLLKKDKLNYQRFEQNSLCRIINDRLYLCPDYISKKNIDYNELKAREPEHCEDPIFFSMPISQYPFGLVVPYNLDRLLRVRKAREIHKIPDPYTHFVWVNLKAREIDFLGRGHKRVIPEDLSLSLMSISACESTKNKYIHLKPSSVERGKKLVRFRDESRKGQRYRDSVKLAMEKDAKRRHVDKKELNYFKDGVEDIMASILRRRTRRRLSGVLGSKVEQVVKEENEKEMKYVIKRGKKTMKKRRKSRYITDTSFEELKSDDKDKKDKEKSRDNKAVSFSPVKRFGEGVGEKKFESFLGLAQSSGSNDQKDPAISIDDRMGVGSQQCLEKSSAFISPLRSPKVVPKKIELNMRGYDQVGASLNNIPHKQSRFKSLGRKGKSNTVNNFDEEEHEDKIHNQPVTLNKRSHIKIRRIPSPELKFRKNQNLMKKELSVIKPTPVPLKHDQVTKPAEDDLSDDSDDDDDEEEEDGGKDGSFYINDYIKGGKKYLSLEQESTSPNGLTNSPAMKSYFQPFSISPSRKIKSNYHIRRSRTPNPFSQQSGQKKDSSESDLKKQAKFISKSSKPPKLKHSKKKNSIKVKRRRYQPKKAKSMEFDSMGLLDINGNTIQRPSRRNNLQRRTVEPITFNTVITQKDSPHHKPLFLDQKNNKNFDLRSLPITKKPTGLTSKNLLIRQLSKYEERTNFVYKLCKKRRR